MTAGKRSILIVDDEQDMLQLLKRGLEPELGCRVVTVDSGVAALDEIGRDRFDLMLADIKMPGMDGMTLLDRVRERRPELTVVMMTAFGGVDLAVEAMKRGAYDFVTKPFDLDAICLRLEKALERSRLITENLRLQENCRADGAFGNIIGRCDAMQRVFEALRTVAKTDLTVLVTGESGTGKELAARAVHELSDRHKGPFVAVNCPTVPENILESELFGYRRGAFTHAVRDKIGLFQEARRGTIFLDEIGDISPTIQTKLLRVLQEKEVKPLGDTRTIQVDVRIVASTNRDLEEGIGRGEFRSDFFYRLNVLRIRMPPLRERTGDIPLIATHLVEKHAVRLERPPKRISPQLMERLVAHRWPGNIRELENVLLQGLLFAEGDEIRCRNVEPLCGGGRMERPTGETLRDRPYKAAKEETLRRFNHRYIGALLTETGGNVTAAARSCGIERQALQQIMRRYGIKADTYRQGTKG